MQRISSTGREFQLCLQKCYEVSLKIEPKKNVVGCILCIHALFMDIFEASSGQMCPDGST